MWMGYKGQKEEPRVKLPMVNDTTKRKWIYVYDSIQSQAVTPSEDNGSQMRDGEVCISGIWGAVQSTVFTRILLTHASQTLKPLISSVQSLSRVWLWSHGLQHTRPPCPSPIPRVYSVSIESVMPSNHLILCGPLLLPLIFPSIQVFSNESVLQSFGQSIGVSASVSVLPMSIQDWFPLVSLSVHVGKKK